MAFEKGQSHSLVLLIFCPEKPRIPKEAPPNPPPEVYEFPEGF
jgi:hypothetical protein